MWGQAEPLPPFTAHLPPWMAGRQREIEDMCEAWGIARFAFDFPLPGIDGGVMHDIHEYENGEWV